MAHDGGLRSVLTDRTFWLGLLGITVGILVFLFLVNYAVMPIWTRHSSAVAVPNVEDMDPSDAERTLRLAGLDAEEREQPFNPNLTPDAVVDQSPAAGLQVKPGRRVYYYVNARPRELVAMPRVVGMAQGQAVPDIEEAGLVIGEVRFDTIRSPNENTVTRQLPVPDRQVPRGTRVSLWLSPGPDRSRQVRVPDVVGLTVEQATDRIREAGLWVDPRAMTGRVTRQQPDRGERKSAGEEVFIFVDGSSESPAPPSDD